jgi:apolipoprotein N-acyltransferase
MRVAPALPKLIIEAIVIGCIICWSATWFVKSAMPIWGGWLHIVGCLCYSSLTVAIAFGLRWTSQFPLPSAAAITALIAVLVEFMQARTLGVTWILSNAALAVAATPLAQWSGVLSPFGLSAVLYWINFSWLPDVKQSRFVCRWAGPMVALVLTIGLWLGGMHIESQVAVGPPPFSSLLVQPASPTDSMAQRQNLWRMLDSATRRSLVGDGAVDLVLWPETSLWESWFADLDLQNAKHTTAVELVNWEETSDNTTLTLPAFRHRLACDYQTNCLVGVYLLRNTTSEKYGLTFPEVRRYNCGCMVDKNGQISCYEKRVIVPLREGFPYWFDWQWLKDMVESRSRFSPNIVEGRGFQTFRFTDSHGMLRTVAVAICYESWLPWLPQYHCEEPLDAICHLAYDGDFKDHPEYTQRMLLTIRLRAIETRTWQLVCSHYAGTAVIDPRGRIVKQLPPGPGVLRTDQL